MRRADVYDRMTIFEDHMIRDINAGRFRDNTSLVLLTHGLALRVFLMRWFHWTVDQFMNVYNPPNAEVRGMNSDKDLYFLFSYSSCCILPILDFPTSCLTFLIFALYLGFRVDLCRLC